MKDNNINYEFIQHYIRTLIPQRDKMILELEKTAKERHIPIVEPEVAKLLEILVLIKKPGKILELGTAIGYSTMIMAKAFKNACITTIEKDKKLADEARDNFKKSSLNNIKVVDGDAVEVLPKINEKYDFIFIDAAKGKYNAFFKQCLRLLNPRGIIVADNVLFRGMVANDELVRRRKITIVKRLRKFLKTISDNDMLETAIIPIGDGVSISIRKGDKTE